MTKHNYIVLRKRLREIYTDNVEDWTFLDDRSNSVLHDDIVNYPKDNVKKCLCGKSIKYMYYIQSDGDKIALIGSKCIKEFMGQKILKSRCIKCKSEIKRKMKNSDSCKDCRKQLKKVAMASNRTLKEIEELIKNNNCLKCSKDVKNKAYEMCYRCKYRCCEECGSRRVLAASTFKNCYKCNMTKKNNVNKCLFR
jgi:hypothetical protein